VADVWVVSDAPVAKDTLKPTSAGPFRRRPEALLPSRAADNLFWLGRYAVRAEGAVRLLRAYHLRLAETEGPGKPLLDLLRDHCSSLGLTVDQPIPPGLLASLDGAKGCAARSRDRFSIDGWLALRDLAEFARQWSEETEPGDDTARALGGLLRRIAGFSGLVQENMMRTMGWRFLTIGRALERGRAMSAILARFTDPGTPPGSFDVAVELADSTLTHNSRYTLRTTRDTVIDLLALDRDNPRSLVYLMGEIRVQVDRLPGARSHGRMGLLARAVLQLETDLRTSGPEDLDTARLTDLNRAFGALSDRVTQAYFN